MKINVNNININYEVYGQGKPIILLHGNSESLDIFDKLVEKLKEEYQVYAIDSRCHGQSDNPDEISYDLMAQDTIECIKKLNLDKPIIYGFSDGGIIALLVAIKEPDLLSKIIISGANTTPNALAWYFTLITKIVCLFTKNKLFKMMRDEPNIPNSDLNKIKIPVHMLVGEKDVIKLEHTKMIKDNISNCTLEILEGENHSSYIVHSEKLYDILKKYI